MDETQKTICNICDFEVVDSYTCMSCGLTFCTECGDSFDLICEECDRRNEEQAEGTDQ